MKCYHCGKDLKDKWILETAAHIMGRRSANAQKDRQRCPIHGNYLNADGKCRKCEGHSPT
jgi:hypothetical protein